MFFFYQTTMCGLVATSELNVRQVSVRSQLKNGCLSGKRIDHLIFLSGNMVERDLIEEPSQLLDVILVGYQLMIPSFSFSSKLVNH